MKVEQTKLPGVMLVTPDIFEDYRGDFVETYNERDYAAMGMDARFVQDDISVSAKNVLRGMHGDHETFKLVSCVYGKVYAVILDCDEKSETFGKWQAFILSDANRRQLYIPPLYGNGYYVLSDLSVYTYKQSAYYSANQFTYRWNDPKFNIRWPSGNPILSERDENGGEKK